MYILLEYRPNRCKRLPNELHFVLCFFFLFSYNKLHHCINEQNIIDFVSFVSS